MPRKKGAKSSRPRVIVTTTAYTALPTLSTPSNRGAFSYSGEHGWAKVAALAAVLVVLIIVLGFLAYLSYAAIVDPGWEEGPLAKPFVQLVRALLYEK